MVVSRNNECPKINIFINWYKHEQRDQIKYLGNIISSDGRNNAAIASRLAQEKKKFP